MCLRSGNSTHFYKQIQREDCSRSVKSMTSNINKDRLRTQYKQLSPNYGKLVEEALFILNTGLKKTDAKIHNIFHRVKEFESFYDKILRKEITTDPFQAIEDIAGIRVVCLYRSDLTKLNQAIDNAFLVIRSETRRTRGILSFGYMSDHYIVKLPKSYKGPRYDDIKNLKCEIQVRTILMDAWDSVSHHLIYKHPIDVPRELRADFDALSGLFYVADTHFELFKSEAGRSLFSLQKAARKGEFDSKQELNLDSLQAYLRFKFPHAREASPVSVSRLLRDLSKSGYKSFDGIEESLTEFGKLGDAGHRAFKWYEKKAGRGRDRHNVGQLRGRLVLVDRSFLKVWKERATREKSATTSDFAYHEEALRHLETLKQRKPR